MAVICAVVDPVCIRRLYHFFCILLCLPVQSKLIVCRDGLFTDEDIDILLKRSEERTEADLSKIKTEIQHTLATFTLKFDEIEMLNLFNFEVVTT